MLTDEQLKELAPKMGVPLERVCFKDELKEKPLKYNRSYIINMENCEDEEGKPNEGSHWVCFQVNRYPDGKVEPIYFDSYGCDCPEEVKSFVGRSHMPHSTKDVQSLMGEACGWFCLAFLHYINTYEARSHDLYRDVEDYLELFDDLNKSVDWKKNEYVLKMFFQSSDSTKRRAIEVFAKPEEITPSP